MPNHRPSFRPPLSRRAQALKSAQPTKAPTPAQTEAAALKAEAAQTWASVTGLPADTWIGQLDPCVEPVVDLVRDALQAGAVVSTHGAWMVVTASDGRRLVLAADLMRDVVCRSTSWR
jgi:hypothetical protein